MRIKVIVNAFPTGNKPSNFTYRRAHHLHVISGLARKQKGMGSHALTYFATVIDYAVLIQILFSIAITF